MFKGATFAHLLTVLNGAPHKKSKLVTCDAGGLARSYTLMFTYNSGPVVSVDIGPDCHPSNTNGTIATDDTHPVVVAVNDLVGIDCSNLIC